MLGLVPGVVVRIASVLRVGFGVSVNLVAYFDCFDARPHSFFPHALHMACVTTMGNQNARTSA